MAPFFSIISTVYIEPYGFVKILQSATSGVLLDVAVAAFCQILERANLGFNHGGF